MSDNKYLGIDIGGTAIKLGIFNEDMEMLHRAEVPVDKQGDEPVMETVFKGADEILEIAELTASSLAGIGVSAAGCVDKNKGAIAKNGGNVPGWAHTEVTRLLKERYWVPVTLVNDGNAVALSESCLGAAAGSSDVLCIAIGTGIGAGIITGGVLLEGSRGFAGEAGHFPTHIGERNSSDSGKGIYFENRASTAALIRGAAKVNPDWASGRILFGAAADGDEKALALIDSWLDELAYGITGLVHLLNPEVVLIGGGVSAQEELLIKPLRKKVLETIKPDFADGLEIKAASLGNDAGMIGAVCYLKEHLAGIDDPQEVLEGTI